MTVLVALAGAILLLSCPAAAQTTRPSVVALDTALALDTTIDGDGDASTGLSADAQASVAITDTMQVIVRPFLQRQGNGDWNAQVWVAGLRYERPGDFGVRVDAGLIPSPIGLANLTLRPHLNPTIAQPSSLFTPLPPVALPMPRATLLGPVYPLGVSVTASTLRWDVRAALIDTSPVRTRRVFADDTPPNPPRFATVVIGGGVTPVVGVRIGASLSHGGWMKPGETLAGARAADATVVTVEGEFSYRYTRVVAEWIRDRLETGSGGTSIADGFYVQAQQTLAPRWFVAGRVERMDAPAASPVDDIIRQQFTGVEETVGYRLLPEVTIRFSHRAREGFGARGFTHTAALSVVFWKRWL